MRKKYIVGNWKMNQTLSEINDFLNQFSELKETFKCETWIAPQSIHLSTVLNSKTNIKVGTQNCHESNDGAFTGELSAKSIKDIGAEFTLIGHSERRSIYGESNSLLNKKTKNALSNNLKVIFCIGESLEERESGQTEKVLENQLKEGLEGINSEDLIIAYEPVWAIGTGKTATPEMAEEAHKNIRNVLNEMDLDSQNISILYGGSVKPSNVEGLLNMPNIDGGLVGGASLKANDYTILCQAASKLVK